MIEGKFVNDTRIFQNYILLLIKVKLIEEKRNVMKDKM